MNTDQDRTPNGRRPHVNVPAPGELYLPGTNDNGPAYFRGQDLLEQFNLSKAADMDHRRQLLHELLGTFGPGSEIRPTLVCDYGSNIHLGQNVYINAGCCLLDVAPITIDDDAQIGPGVQIITANHPLEAEPRRQKWETAAPVTIGANTWLGAGVIVVPGRTIGANAVVGAGSVVTKDLPAGVLAVGSPARIIRTLS